MASDHILEPLDYLYEELPPEAMAEARRHLAGCPQCRRDMRSIRETVKFYRQLDNPKAPPGLASRTSDAALKAARTTPRVARIQDTSPSALGTDTAQERTPASVGAPTGSAAAKLAAMAAMPGGRTPETATAGTPTGSAKKVSPFDVEAEFARFKDEVRRDIPHGWRTWLYHPAWTVAAGVLLLGSLLIQLSPRLQAPQETFYIAGTPSRSDQASRSIRERERLPASQPRADDENFALTAPPVALSEAETLNHQPELAELPPSHLKPPELSVAAPEVAKVDNDILDYIDEIADSVNGGKGAAGITLRFNHLVPRSGDVPVAIPGELAMAEADDGLHPPEYSREPAGPGDAAQPTDGKTSTPETAPTANPPASEAATVNKPEASLKPPSPTTPAEPAPKSGGPLTATPEPEKTGAATPAAESDPLFATPLRRTPVQSGPENNLSPPEPPIVPELAPAPEKAADSGVIIMGLTPPETPPEIVRRPQPFNPSERIATLMTLAGMQIANSEWDDAWRTVAMIRVYDGNAATQLTRVIVQAQTAEKARKTGKNPADSGAPAEKKKDPEPAFKPDAVRSFPDKPVPQPETRSPRETAPDLNFLPPQPYYQPYPQLAYPPSYPQPYPHPYPQASGGPATSPPYPGAVPVTILVPVTIPVPYPLPATDTVAANLLPPAPTAVPEMVPAVVTAPEPTEAKASILTEEPVYQVTVDAVVDAGVIPAMAPPERVTALAEANLLPAAEALSAFPVLPPQPIVVPIPEEAEQFRFHSYPSRNVPKKRVFSTDPYIRGY